MTEGARAWVRLALNDPSLSDDDGWDDVTNYSTIQTAVVKGQLYLLARSNRGIHTWAFHPGSNDWVLRTVNMPVWSDAAGWNDITNYSTIQTAALDDALYLLGRGNAGISTWIRRQAFTSGTAHLKSMHVSSDYGP